MTSTNKFFLYIIVVIMGVLLIFTQDKIGEQEEDNIIKKEEPTKYITFTTGDVDGIYYPQGKIISKYMSNKGHSMKVVSSEGAEQNGRRVLNGLSDLGLVQKDTHYLLSTLDEGYSQNVKIIDSIRQESVFFIINKKNNIKTIEDIQNNSVKIAISSNSSGAVSTLSIMSKLDNSFENKEIIFMDFGESIEELRYGTIDVIMLVQSVGIRNKKLETVLKDDNLDFVNINNDLLTTQKLNGRVVYDKCNVSIVEGFLFDKKVDTICTEALIVTTKKLRNNVINDIRNVLIDNSEEIKRRVFFDR